MVLAFSLPGGFHICRQSSIDDEGGVALLDRDTAKTYAEWFRTLADPTRVQILNLLAEVGPR